MATGGGYNMTATTTVGAAAVEGARLGADERGGAASPFRGEQSSQQSSKAPRDRSRSPRRVEESLSAHDHLDPFVTVGNSLASASFDAQGGREASGSPRQESTSPRQELVPTVPLYPDVNPDNWVARVVGKNAMGSPTICIYDNSSRTTPEFCLYKGDECGTLVFQLEPRKDAERPAFMTGAESTKKVESLDLTITLEGDQLAFVRQVDESIKKMALENSKEWFQRTCTATEIDVMYSSPVKVDDSGRWAPHLRARMNLAGIDRYLTQVTFVRANDTPEEGSGWEFVESRLGEHKWRGHRARVVLEARRVWIVGRKFGLSYSVRDIAVRERPQKRATPFTCDNSVECLGALSA